MVSPKILLKTSNVKDQWKTTFNPCYQKTHIAVRAVARRTCSNNCYFNPYNDFRNPSDTTSMWIRFVTSNFLHNDPWFNFFDFL
ncbi:unnamed protein product [Rhizophagus irregularis]|nr:unnamed protein product [Rhizophagus irregularis]CAB4415496.1 unnamed protein product [Rhizophagus irregularis]